MLEQIEFTKEILEIVCLIIKILAVRHFFRVIKKEKKKKIKS